MITLKQQADLKVKLNKATTEVLIQTLTTIWGDNSKMMMNVLIQEVLESRMSEEDIDKIITNLRNQTK